MEATLALLLAYRYWLLAPLTLINGPAVMVVCGFLIRLGTLDLLPTYLLLMAGDFVGDVIWYYVGRHGARSFALRYGRYFSLNVADIERFEEVFARHQIKILFISKLTMGLGFALAILMAAGAARVPFRTYALINLLGGFVWTAILLAVGYYFAHAYLFVGQGLHVGALIGAGLVLALVAWGGGKVLFARFIKS